MLSAEEFDYDGDESDVDDDDEYESDDADELDDSWYEDAGDPDAEEDLRQRLEDEKAAARQRWWVEELQKKQQQQADREYRDRLEESWAAHEDAGEA
jgi:hypothetical protein